MPPIRDAGSVRFRSPLAVVGQPTGPAGVWRRDCPWYHPAVASRAPTGCGRRTGTVGRDWFADQRARRSGRTLWSSLWPTSAGCLTAVRLNTLRDGAPNVPAADGSVPGCSAAPRLITNLTLRLSRPVPVVGRPSAVATHPPHRAGGARRGFWQLSASHVPALAALMASIESLG
jgi:hypothetical protein